MNINAYLKIHIEIISFNFNNIFPCLLPSTNFLVLVTIELQATVETHGTSWELIGTNCKSLPNIIVAENRLYTRYCALSIGQSYTLKCNDVEGGGWASNYLIIENSKYCENTQQMSMVNITITGIC